MSAGLYNMTCEQGATFTRVITWEDSDAAPINLTGYTAAMQVRTIQDDLIVSLTNGSGITLGGSAGTITITITATATGAFEEGEYVYDLFLTSAGGVAYRLLAGQFEVTKRVTV